MDAAFWGLVFALTHTAAFVIGAVLGGAAVVAAIHGFRLLPQRLPVRSYLPQNPALLAKGKSAEEKAAEWEAAWTNPLLGVKDFSEVPLRGAVKRATPGPAARETGAAFQLPTEKGRLARQPESGSTG